MYVIIWMILKVMSVERFVDQSSYCLGFSAPN